jgi:phosphoesterase, MJ0936 family
MKLMFASDIHGSAYYCKKMITAYKKEKAERLLLLGDILYHGPRNELPKDYNPQDVISLLNGLKNEIYAVRGNCDSEVDQMVLEFPIMADYSVVFNEKSVIYMTHGHIHNIENTPPMKAGDILIHGHTHVLKAESHREYYLINPGSVSLPKEGNVPTYAILENNTFYIKDFNENIIKELKLTT